jgi:hypothetical protein
MLRDYDEWRQSGGGSGGGGSGAVSSGGGGGVGDFADEVTAVASFSGTSMRAQQDARGGAPSAGRIAPGGDPRARAGASGGGGGGGRDAVSSGSVGGAGDAEEGPDDDIAAFFRAREAMKKRAA